MLDDAPRLTPVRFGPGVDSTLPASVQCALGRLQHWIEHDVASAKLELGRSGDVCPFVRPGVTRYGGIHFAPYFGRPLRFDAIVSFMRESLVDFPATHPVEAPGSGFKAVIAVFSELATDLAPSMIDAVQIFLKREVIRAGLMIGQFYPGCTEPGLHNPDFRPLDSPYPLLVVRPMQLTDLQFLTAVPEFLQAYCDHFGIRSRQDLETRLEKAGIDQLPKLWEENRRRAFGS